MSVTLNNQQFDNNFDNGNHESGPSDFINRNNIEESISWNWVSSTASNAMGNWKTLSDLISKWRSSELEHYCKQFKVGESFVFFEVYKIDIKPVHTCNTCHKRIERDDDPNSYSYSFKIKKEAQHCKRFEHNDTSWCACRISGKANKSMKELD